MLTDIGIGLFTFDHNTRFEFQENIIPTRKLLANKLPLLPFEALLLCRTLKDYMDQFMNKIILIHGQYAPYAYNDDNNELYVFMRDSRDMRIFHMLIIYHDDNKQPLQVYERII